MLHGFGYLLACKLALYPEEDLVSAYAPRFAAEWTGLPRSTARWTLSRLRALGLLVQVGVLRTRHGRSIRLYAPGWRASAREGTSSL